MKFFLFKLSICTAFLTFLVSSCEKNEDLTDQNSSDPEVCFEMTEGDLYAEMPLFFNASCSSPASYYIWDFGDGKNDTGEELSHTYAIEGQYTVTLSTGNHQDSLKTIKKTIEILPSPFTKHSGFIDTDEIWEEGLHLITGTVTVRNGSLTILPGAEVYFSTNKSLVIGHENGIPDAMFSAEGTVDKPIIFMPANKSDVPGSWGVILFRPQASDACSMEYCQISYGGQIGSTDFWLDEDRRAFGSIYVEETRLNFQHCSVTGSKTYGIRLTENAGFTGFAHNTFSSNLKNPVYIGIDQLHTLDEANTMVGEHGILVHSYWFNQESATWHKQDVPYIIENEVKFASSSKLLTISPGTEIQFADRWASIDFGSASLKAIGTSAEPILFTSGQEVPARGDWMGIYVRAKCEMEYCTIEYAGAPTFNNYKHSIQAGSEAAVSINHSTIRESGGIALAMERSKNLVSMKNNTIDGSDSWGITMHAQAVTHMDYNNTIINTKGFLVNGSIDSNTHWIKRDFPYVIDYEVSVNSQDASLPVLTIDPGVEIQLTTGSRIKIIHGELHAEGTQELPISFDLFESDKLAQTGNWNSILFGFEYDWHANTGNSVMTYCTISNGGSSYYNSQNGAIYCWNSTNSPLIEHCTISNSETYGIVSRNSSPQINNCTFTGNQLDDTLDL